MKRKDFFIFLFFSLLLVILFAGRGEKKHEVILGDGFTTVADLLKERSLVAPPGTAGLQKIFKVVVIYYGGNPDHPGVGFRKMVFSRPPDTITLYLK